MAEAPWLTLIGIGDNGRNSLSGEALRALDGAAFVVASRRVLDEVGPLDAETADWSAGVAETIAVLKARRGTPITVLATGDPMHYGIGATLLRSFPAEEMRVLPSPSAFSLAAARLGWPLQEADCLSLHGRDAERLIPHLGANRRLIALTSDVATISAAADILERTGYGASTMTVLEHMGGSKERRWRGSAGDVRGQTFAAFNTLGIVCLKDRFGTIDGAAPGLPDHAFIYDGQMTKQEVRALVLALLRPGGAQHLWDVGAGCGSVSVEWLRASATARVSAVEPNRDRRAMIAQNARLLGVPQIEIVAGRAPAALSGLARPDAVFIGGGLTGEGVFEAAWSALPRFGRMVATAVTLESEARLIALYGSHGGSLSRLAVARAEPVGRLHGWKPFMPVTVWSVEKDAS